MKPTLAFLCILLMACFVLLNISCRKTKAESNEEKINLIRAELSSKPQKVFTGHIPRTSDKVIKQVGKVSGGCDYDITYELFYSIIALPCGTSSPGPSPGSTNDYQIDFDFYLYTDPENCGPPRNVVPDPVLSNIVVTINGNAITVGTSNPLPTDACGYLIFGSEKFTDVGVTCADPDMRIDISGTYSSTSCSPSQNFLIDDISPDLEPSVCTGSQYATGITAEVFPNIAFSPGQFLLFFPWDLACYSSCFIPTTWTQVEIEYYKSPSGTPSTQSFNYLPTGPYQINVSSGSGTYYVRARYKCSGGGTGQWSTWKSVPVS